MSHVSVSSKVKALEEEGIIKGYTVIIDHDKLNHYMLCLKISTLPGSDIDELERQVALHPEIDTMMRISGDCEIMAFAVCKSRESALELLNEVNAIKGIGGLESQVVLESIKYGSVMLKP